MLDIAARGTSTSPLAGIDPGGPSFSKSLPSSWRVTVPLNYGAYLNDSFTGLGVLPLEFTDPKLYANFFAWGGGPPYKYGPLDVSSTGSFSVPTSVYTTSSTTTATVEEVPVPSLYEGREVGGGPRNNIYGSSRWGSGLGNSKWWGGGYQWFYDAGVYNLRPSFSFGFWPICWGSIENYYPLSLPYKSPRFRPGGAQNLILASLHEDIPNSPYYYIVADAYTIKGINSILSLPVAKGGCDMYPDNPIYVFEPEQLAPNGTGTLVPVDGSSRSRQSVVIGPESAMQYYRGSSVVLGTPGYLNEFGLNHNKNTTYWGTTLWNLTELFPNFFNNSSSQNTGVNMTLYQMESSFLDCLNITIAAAIPIIDTNLTEEKPLTTTRHTLSAGEISAIVVCIFFAFVVFSACWIKRRQLRFLRKPPPEYICSEGQWDGQQVMLPGEVLPSYSRYPAGHYNPSYRVGQRPSDQPTNFPFLPYTRNSHDTAERSDEFPPPYTRR
jgi:hypothetical protein